MVFACCSANCAARNPPRFVFENLSGIEIPAETVLNFGVFLYFLPRLYKSIDLYPCFKIFSISTSRFSVVAAFFTPKT